MAAGYDRCSAIATAIETGRCTRPDACVYTAFVSGAKPSDFSERLRRVLDVFAGEGRLEHADDLEHRSGGRLGDAAARALGSTLERWGRSPTVRKLFGGVERDVLTSPGEWVELAGKLGVTAQLGTHVRFYLGEEVVAELPIPEGSEIRAIVRAPQPGLYPVRLELRSAKGKPVTDLVGNRVVQVAGEHPVILVDADLLLPANRELGPSLEVLRALHAARLELAYFDIHEKNRHAQIAEVLEAHRIPAAAILIYSAQEHELRSLGVDFLQMFWHTAVHKLRAYGVPVTTIVSARFGASEESEVVTVLRPREATRRARAGEFGEAREQARALRAARAASDPVTWRLDQATASRVLRGNELHIELDNRRARERLFELIRSAEHSLHLQFYMVRPSTFTERLVFELIERARAGVRVRFMYDALYSDDEILGRANPLMASMRAEPEVEILALAPIESRHDVDVSRLKHRDHRKLVIVDGRRALVSGRNAADEYYTGFDEVPVHDNTPHERIPWFDAHVEIVGPLVGEVQRSFLATWKGHGGAAILDDESELLPSLPPVAGDAGSDARLVVHEGLVDMNALAMYEALLDLAEDHVYIVTDYPIVSVIDRAIRRVLARGVRVELLTGNAAARRADGSFFPTRIHRTLFELMVKARFEPLLEAGVEMYEFVSPPTAPVVSRGGCYRPYVHAKLMSIDGRICSIGSANLDATASFWESEANVVVQDPRVVARLEAKLRGLIDRSVRLDRDSEYWRSERAQRALVSTLWPGAIYS
jgi:phosphatidylserine/phosphatidylglycerophosphate/cardiolipin synthase-like enzyme